METDCCDCACVFTTPSHDRLGRRLPRQNIPRRCQSCHASHLAVYAKENGAKWRAENPRRQKDTAARWYAENTARAKENSRRWQAENPEKQRAIVHRHRTLKAAAEGSFTAEEFTALCEAYDNRCAYCGCDDTKLTADHATPLSRGGANYISNILPACRSCNSRKGTETPEEFLSRVGGMKERTAK